MSTAQRSSAPKGETPQEWWERVRAEHGPPPQRIVDLWVSTCRAVARNAEPTRRGAGGRS